MAKKGNTTRKQTQQAFDRRTVIVLSSLIASMTAVAGLLLRLEPAPLRSSASNADLRVLSGGNPASMASVFETQAPLNRRKWKAIVVHHSGDMAGNSATIGLRHEQAGFGGLGYNFLIGNGQGAGDGEVQVGYRWTHQLDGAHAAGPHAAWLNKHSISVCIVGNGDKSAPTPRQMERLVQLVTALQDELRIPPQNVYLHSDVAPMLTSSPGLHFRATEFRQQLRMIVPD